MGQPIWHSSPHIDVISYSDASSSGRAGYVVQLGKLVVQGDWNDLDYLQSFTFRERKAVRLVSFSAYLSSKECKHRPDNQGTVSIMSIREYQRIPTAGGYHDLCYLSSVWDTAVSRSGFHDA